MKLGFLGDNGNPNIWVFIQVVEEKIISQLG
jgi:hypothetical protein